MLAFVKQLLFRYKIFFIASAICALAFLLAVFVIYLHIDQLSTPLIFHFDKLNGIDISGSPIDLWRFLLAGFMMILINIILSYEFYYRERILSYFFLAANFLFSILSLIIVFLIVSTN